MPGISENLLPYQTCSVCSALADREHASQKFGWPETDTFLPEAARRLNVIRDFKPHGSRLLQLQQCPGCQTYYLYKTDYEFLVNGSEDEEHLTRLTDEAAAEYLNRPAPG